MVISVQCPTCSTAFPVDTAKVPEAGVYARCSVCEGVFLVARPAEALAGVPASGARGLSAPTIEHRDPEAWRAPQQSTEDGSPDFTIVAEPEPSEPVEAAPSSAAPALTELDPEPVSQSQITIERATPAPTPEPASAPAPAARPATPEPQPEAQPFSFGRRDPHEKARRLARVLVSDMIMYNPDRHSRAIAAGSLRADFEEEIRKSWQEYVEQVGDEMARSTPYFDEALNDILARGERLFP